MVKPIYLYAELRRNAKNNFEKDFFKLMNNSVFEKTIENEKKHRDIELVTAWKRESYFLIEQNYQQLCSQNIYLISKY